MKTTRPTKQQIKMATLRVDTLAAEVKSEYTRRLGPAAVRSVRETLRDARRQLRELLAA